MSSALLDVSWLTSKSVAGKWSWFKHSRPSIITFSGAPAISSYVPNSIYFTEASSQRTLAHEQIMNLYVGTSGYAYKQWKGKFYPKDLPPKQMLRYYAERFGTVETNNTFYSMPKASAVAAWAAEVPGDFKFAVKAPQRITHMRRLKNAGELVSELLDAAGTLKKRLGPLLFQLPPTFKKDVLRLREFLALLPRRRRVAFEFRHPSWFDEEVFALLRKHQSALCIAEEKDDLKVPLVATTNWGYLRLRRPDYDRAQLKKWVKLVLKQSWQDAFVFFKHEDEGKGPRFAQRFLELAG
jgi:uncharacterized protein YecE (DUF72 family)